MAHLLDPDGVVLPLQAEHLVGRAQGADLRLEDPLVSAHHAALRWTGATWELRDLNSRNGTFVGGKRVEPGIDLPIPAGTHLGFGAATPVWQLEGGSPRAWAIDGASGEAFRGETELLNILDAELLLFNGREWVFDGEGAGVVQAGSMLTVAGRDFRLLLPYAASLTRTAEQVTTADVTLELRVSSDEEHVDLTVRLAGRKFVVGERTYNYLLVTLARARQKDSDAGMTAAECGWVYQEDLVRRLRTTDAQVYLDLHRARKCLLELGAVDVVHLVERRRSTRQVRLAVGALVLRSG